MSSTFEIRVLGDFTVSCDDAPVPLPQSRKTRALLAYLAVLQKQQRRERLCEMFWDVPDDPRGALRWSLSKLRQILNADGETRLAADRNTVHLKPGAVRLDYDLIRGLSSDAVGSLPTERLEAIVKQYTQPSRHVVITCSRVSQAAWRGWHELIVRDSGDDGQSFESVRNIGPIQAVVMMLSLDDHFNQPLYQESIQVRACC